MTKERSRMAELKSLILLALTVMCGLFLSKEMGEYVIQGMNLAVMSVIPSSLPFMIFSDLYTHYGHPENMKCIGKAFSRIFRLPLSSLSVMVCGNVGGFPIGAKMTADLFKNGGIDKESAERLIPLSSNPSCAFVIGAVGLGMYNSFAIGILLILSIYMSCIVCAYISNSSGNKIDFSTVNIEQKYSFVASVKSAGTSLVSIVAFISCFSVVVGLIKNHIKNNVLSSFVIMFIEVTNATKIFSSEAIFSPGISLILSAFSLGFGGLSVMMQSSIFIEKSGLSMRKYFSLKLLQGLLSSTFTYVGYMLFLA